jgi:RNA polymerase sigma factor (sigma-70 family)
MALEWGTGPNMTTISDEQLALRGAQGDRRAFEAIYRRYHQDLYRFCLAILGSPHDAQDALQGTMVRVLRALPGEKRQIKLKPWLYRIARNEAIDALRRRRERVEPEPEEAAPSEAQIAERAEDRERLRRLLADLEQLPERQRGALVMRELSGLSFEEIAETFETSPATARQTVYEARLGLRQMEAGREMRCDAVTRALSDADGRSRRRRDLRAHLRECPECRAFAAGIDERGAELAALAPLPLGAASGIMHGILAGNGAGAAAGGAAGAATGGGLGGAAAGGAGKVVTSSVIAKSAATVAVVALVGASSAGRLGLIDLPLAAHDGQSREAPSRAAAGAAAASRVDEGGQPRGDGRRAGPATHPALAGAAAADGTGPAGRPTNPATHPDLGRGESSAPGSAAVPAHGHSAAHRAETPTKAGHPSHGPATAAAHGQQTATAHKSPHGNPSPGSARRAKPAHSGGAVTPRGKAKEPGNAAKSPPGQSKEGGEKEASSGGESGVPEAPEPASGHHGLTGPVTAR